jgi:hypothetical protein
MKKKALKKPITPVYIKINKGLVERVSTLEQIIGELKEMIEYLDIRDKARGFSGMEIKWRLNEPS